MSALFTQLKDLWQRLSLAQRTSVVLAALATLGLLGLLVFFGTQPEYGVLFADLKTADAQAIVEKLKAGNVPYRLSNGGAAIHVPNERVAELRLQMAGEGTLNGGHVGFDLFDKSSFGATDFAQRVNYRRALEGELARTLEGMDEVAAARVHITPARESIFTEKGEPAKASIVLRVRQNRELSRERTAAVVNLVASAVEGLTVDDVSVLDTRGRLLSAPARGGLGARGTEAFNSQLEARQRFEADTAARIIALLEPVVGVGRVRANVAAELDFSQIEQTEEKYDPASAVIRSQQSSADVRRNQLAPESGVVGARANDPAAGPTPAATMTPTPNPLFDQRTASTTNYEIDKTIKRTVDGGGRVQRLSVSVVVDHQMVNGKPAPRGTEELRKLQELIAAATGTDSRRGDQVVVQSIPFEQTPEVPPTPIERYRDFINTGIKYGALLMATLLVLFFIIRPARRALQGVAQQEPLLLKAAPNADAPALTVGQAINAADSQAALPAASSDAARSGKAPGTVNVTNPRTVAELEAEMARELAAAPVAEVKRARAIRQVLLEQGTREPETLATTIRSWLQDG